MSNSDDNKSSGSTGGAPQVPTIPPVPAEIAGAIVDPIINEEVDESGLDADPELIARYGDPVVLSQGKDDVPYVSGINEAFWAGLYASENKVIYEPDERLFYKYDDTTGLWNEITADLIKQEISARLLECAREVEGWDRLERHRSSKRLTAIVSQLRGIVERRGFFSEKRFRAVHFRNQFIVFFGTMKGPAGFAETFRSRNRSPISYDREASCPRFLGELIGPIVSPEDVILIQKLAGQFLLGLNLTQRVLVVDGEAGRGKTQLANILQEIVGRTNVGQLRTQHLENRFEISRLLGRSLLVGVDVSADFLSQRGASSIKGLVGGDWMDAEKKGSNASFQVQGNFNVMMTSNSRLRVRLQQDVAAWRRRLLVVRCGGPPPKRKIPDFAKVLVRDEGAGIVNWALDGLRMLLTDIDETGDIRLTPAQSEVVGDLLAESDSVRNFLEALVVKQQGSQLTGEALRQRYAEYCADQGWAPLPESQINGALKNLMRELFQVEQSHDLMSAGRARRGFRGITFTE